MKRAHFVAGLAMVAAAAPLDSICAQTLPNWPISEVCAKESAPGQCAAFEGRAHKAVSGGWAFVLDSAKSTCLAQVKSPLDRSWRLLAECIDVETIKALDKRAVHTAKTPAEPVPPPRPPAPPPAPELSPQPATGEPPKAQ